MNDIKAGDLVMIVKVPNCGCAHALGKVFRVSGVRESYGSVIRCIRCDRARPPALVAMGHQSALAYEIWRLKKIPPLAEPQSEVTREERSTPAEIAR